MKTRKCKDTKLFVMQLIIIFVASATLAALIMSLFQVLCKPSLWCRIEIH